MSQDADDAVTTDPETPAEAPATPVAASEAPKSASEPPEPAPEPAAADPVEELRAERAKLRDQLLRTAADYDNFRKRAKREVEDAYRRGREETVRELLPVFDNLERAAQHADQATEVKSVSEGVRMVLRQFIDTLAKAGIQRVATVGHPFDPTHHEAIQQIESADHPAGTVVAEVQPGYALGDRLVRAALVVVAKPGSPKPEAEAAPASTTSESDAN